MRVLVVDDSPSFRGLVQRTLRDMAYDVALAADGREAFTLWSQQRFPVLIADWCMPVMDGIELIRRIRAESCDSYTYVILLSARSARKDALQAFASGADDVIAKPFDPDLLWCRMRVAERILGLQAQLQAHNQELQSFAFVDSLTGIANRRRFDLDYPRHLNRSLLQRRPFGLAMIDIDRFKQYNDASGHRGGDKVLQCVAQVLDRSVRAPDQVFRVGGEEFACILPDTNADGALTAGRRLRALVEAIRIPHPHNRPFGVVTISAGIAAADPSKKASAGRLVQQADAALYAAKEQGRNVVVAYDESSMVLERADL